MMTLASRRSRIVVALAAALVLAGTAAEARVGGGRSSFGSRGMRTWSAPPSTSTAPGTVSPMQRSQVPNMGPTYSRPGMTGPSVAQPRRFGFGTGLMAGLFGAGLLGLLTGHGFFGGLSGLGSVLGFLFQIGLLVFLASLALSWFRRRQPAYAGPQGYERSMPGGSVPPAGYGIGPAGAPRPGVRDEVGINERDYAAFEQALGEIQEAYSRNDVARLWTLATPEMAGYMQEELNDNAARGVVNRVTGVRLLQGDLSEAWREGGADYATVAMRFSMIDVTTDRASGRVVEGDPSRPVEATEIWTFRRDQGGLWKLSAIQQT